MNTLRIFLKKCMEILKFNIKMYKITFNKNLAFELQETSKWLINKGRGLNLALVLAHIQDPMHLPAITLRFKSMPFPLPKKIKESVNTENTQ